MLAVVDYGLGNLRSICAALDRLEIDYRCTSDPSIISDADGLILPGVGSFPDGMRNLRDLGLDDLLGVMVFDRRIPILGICLGFQLMARVGTEFGLTPGLSWLAARVVRFEGLDPSLRIPHVGWNDCVRTRDSPIFSDIPSGALFYFTHSYYMECEDPSDVIAHSDHGKPFVAAIHRGNILGTQFHPEKSQLHGLILLRNFVEKMVREC